MSKVTIGHDSCTTWTCGSVQGPRIVDVGPFDTAVLGDATEGPVEYTLRYITAPFLPVYWLYKGTKAVSKYIRTSR